MSCSRRSKIVATLVCGLLFTYILAYSIFSYHGRYYEIAQPDGRTLAIYAPRHLVVYVQLRHNKKGLKIANLGNIFLPLIILDRNFIHATRLTVSAKGDGKRVLAMTPDGRYFHHPDK